MTDSKSRFAFMKKLKGLRRSSYEDVTAGSGLTGELTLIILSASDLPVSSNGTAFDPYCVAHIISPSGIHTKASRTGVRKKTTAPDWRDEIKIPTILDGEKLVFYVKHWTRMGRPKVIAEGSVNLHELIGGKEERLVVPLSPSGELIVKVLYEDNTDLFGLAVEDACVREGRPIPYIITRCICEIESRGITDVGLYRTAGNARLCRTLKTEFIKDAACAKISSDVIPTVSTVASLLKLYLRELPEQIFTMKYYSAFLDLTSQQLTDEARIRVLQGTIAALPKPNYDIVVFLFDHLHRVCSLCEYNKMTTQSLATCLGPSLFTPAGSEVQSSNVQQQNVITQFMLDNWEELRKGLEPPDVPKEDVESLAAIRARHPRRAASVVSTRSTLATILSDTTDSSIAELAASLADADEEEQLEHLKAFLGFEGTPTEEQELVLSERLMELKSYRESIRIARARSYVQKRRKSSAPASPHVQFASALFNPHALTEPDSLTAEEFHSLCYELGYYLEDTSAFESIANGSPSVSRSRFLAWWGSAGGFLAPIYASYRRHRHFTQAVSYFQYYDVDKTGVIEGPSFILLHQDLLNHAYAHIPEDVVECYCQIKQTTRKKLKSNEPWTCSFNCFVSWLIRIDAVDQKAKSSSSLATTPESAPPARKTISTSPSTDKGEATEEGNTTADKCNHGGDGSRQRTTTAPAKSLNADV